MPPKDTSSAPIGRAAWVTPRLAVITAALHAHNTMDGGETDGGAYPATPTGKSPA
ncbi:MAG: hypothetical protein QG597_1965 [Actinomycetota bacterium]|nr:hypothetical protein [Actinomycetota bacterium]